MAISINIPNDHERTLRAIWGDELDRIALDAILIEGYRSGKLSAAELGRILGMQDRWATNRWLAEHRVPLNYTIDDLEADRKTLDRVLGKSA